MSFPVSRHRAPLQGGAVRKIYIYERRAGDDRRIFPRENIDHSDHDRRKCNGVLPVILFPGRMILPRERLDEHIEH
jgi:hypothetical protein